MASTLYNQVNVIHLGVRQVRGEMRREIFLYGHFIYGHHLGRYFRLDDLKAQWREKQEPWVSCLLFYSIRASKGFTYADSTPDHTPPAHQRLARATTFFKKFQSDALCCRVRLKTQNYHFQFQVTSSNSALQLVEEILSLSTNGTERTCAPAITAP